jgi:thymidylate synthase
MPKTKSFVSLSSRLSKFNTEIDLKDEKEEIFNRTLSKSFDCLNLNSSKDQCTQSNEPSQQELNIIAINQRLYDEKFELLLQIQDLQKKLEERDQRLLHIETEPVIDTIKVNVNKEEIEQPKEEEPCNQLKENKHPEYQYLDLVRKIIEKGVPKPDRTLVGTLSLIAAQIEFDVSEECFPMLTSKKVFFRQMAKELEWFIRGLTDVKYLQRFDCKIWDFDTTLDNLKKKGKTDLSEYDAGAIYGFQWRHFGANYEGCDKNYKNCGFDQLANVVCKIQKDIKEDKYSRDYVINSWDPTAMPMMSLPPCHFSFSFYTEPNQNKNEAPYISIIWNQRSTDTMLGLPFNLSSYSLLLIFISKILNLTPKKVVGHLQNVHIYNNHIENAKTQMKRQPMQFPKLNCAGLEAFMKKKKKKPTSVEDFAAIFDKFESEWFKIENYTCHEALFYEHN